LWIAVLVKKKTKFLKDSLKFRLGFYSFLHFFELMQENNKVNKERHKTIKIYSYMFLLEIVKKKLMEWCIKLLKTLWKKRF
jgi:hypothetical protein